MFCPFSAVRDKGRSEGLEDSGLLLLKSDPCVCVSSDQRRAVFWRLRSAGCQLPVGHRHHLPAQRWMRAEDLHPGRIHADGCRLVGAQAGPEPMEEVNTA